ncbi:helix-turn-helix transcriptional regulator [Paenibacillus polymyxa]|uniref:helix-turn-helix domain-containing protein n=1 Tax=Paenibacillus TaxID=44249 RepID=UPI0002D52552|nr:MULTISPECIES: helix-turn-helix transcriptional regulator [Paenibacillus]AJE50213.1 transcriptional regulator [Paenibacillus polymyxa]AZH28855.1 XRE family transcriptional regulator [Paenibacillus sp. M-152]KJD41088.1 transcriptional regulator [Paenibacillus polymyxa]KKD56383.1 transcriptional regulator [Paenibacillus sp. ICGEB2008]MBY7735412.1 helix-turn-helix domain-containing protein [Paenibacillus polymyxa]
MEDKEVLKLVGARIRALRKEKGLSQESLGEKGGFHFSYIGQIERGEKNVSLINIAKIADALDVNLIQLFAYVNEDIKVTKHEDGIQEIVNILQKTSPEKVRLARNVIREIIN